MIRARAIIAMLRENGAPVAMLREDMELLADLAQEGIDSLRNIVETVCVHFDRGWMDSKSVHDGIGGEVSVNEAPWVGEAIDTLALAGEIERDPENPRRVRFVEEP